MEKSILLERLKIRKPPTEFQDACLKTFCAVRARLQLEDVNAEGQAIWCARGFHYRSWFSMPPFSGIYIYIHIHTHIYIYKAPRKGYTLKNHTEKGYKQKMV